MLLIRLVPPASLTFGNIKSMTSTVADVASKEALGNLPNNLSIRARLICMKFDNETLQDHRNHHYMYVRALRAMQKSLYVR
jgi:hypothetical protein